MMRHPTDYNAVLATPFGALGWVSERNLLIRIDSLPPGTTAKDAENAFDTQVAAELGSYLHHHRHTPMLPIKRSGTDFQQRVWAMISAIPPGATRTYGELAAELGSAPRAVGQACGANPTPIVVPCHRVVSAHHAGGFAHAREGYLIDTKRWLLAHEQT